MKDCVEVVSGMRCNFVEAPARLQTVRGGVDAAAVKRARTGSEGGPLGAPTTAE